jgi:hypothetical protein
MSQISDITGDVYLAIHGRINGITYAGATIPVIVAWGGVGNLKTYITIEQANQAPASTKTNDGYYVTVLIEVVNYGADYEKVTAITNSVLQALYDDEVIEVGTREAVILKEPTITELIEDNNGEIIMRKQVRLGVEVL